MGAALRRRESVVHSWMFAGTGAQSEDHQLVINVAPMLNDPVFDPLLIRLDVAVPADVTVPVAVSTPKVLPPGKLRPLATWGLWMSIVVAALTGICALLTLAIARSRGGCWPVSVFRRCWSALPAGQG